MDAPCLDCGESIVVEIKDGKLQKVEPEGVVGYVAVPFFQWFKDIPFA